MCLPSQSIGRFGPPLLPPGRFGVGFRSTWEFDQARTYRTEFDHLQELVGRTADRIVEETKKRAAA